jgi:HK97 gp10 family phage protein
MSSLTVTADTKGLDEILRYFAPEADALVRGVALGIEAYAKIAAPVDTGFLRSSIQMTDDRPGDAEAEVIVGAEYGPYVEYGTVHQRAQPYFTPALVKGRRRLSVGVNRLAKKLERSGK